jgi:hypothetical protein
VTNGNADEGRTTDMDINSLIKFWPLIYSVIQEFWSITEPHIEEAALRDEIPIDLYYYSELGLDYFSIEEFQNRDPFSNTEKFERLFARLDVKGWIEPVPHERYQVTEQARQGARHIIQVGDEHLMGLEPASELDLGRLANLLKQIVMANDEATEPPRKWAINKRFRVVDKNSPFIVQIREYLMDLFAYRDDSHLSASRPYFNKAGIVWSVLGSLWKGDALTPEKMAETMAFRGYEDFDYQIAIQAAVEVGWAEEAGAPGTFHPTQQGKEIREQAEKLTNEYFYAPWSVMTQDELHELYDLLSKLRDQLHTFRKSK